MKYMLSVFLDLSSR